MEFMIRQLCAEDKIVYNLRIFSAKHHSSRTSCESQKGVLRNILYSFMQQKNSPVSILPLSFPLLFITKVYRYFDILIKISSSGKEEAEVS